MGIIWKQQKYYVYKRQQKYQGWQLFQCLLGQFMHYFHWGHELGLIATECGTKMSTQCIHELRHEELQERLQSTKVGVSSMVWLATKRPRLTVEESILTSQQSNPKMEKKLFQEILTKIMIMMQKSSWLLSKVYFWQLLLKWIWNLSTSYVLCNF